MCIANPDSMGGTSGGGGASGGSGGTSVSSGTGAKSGSSPSGSEATRGGRRCSDSGACSTNADCIAQALDQPAICVQKSGGNECVVLTNKQCPVLLPTTVAGSSALQLLKTNSPVILGGFASMTNSADPHDTLAVVNWDMAFEEFQRECCQELEHIGISAGARR